MSLNLPDSLNPLLVGYYGDEGVKLPFHEICASQSTSNWVKRQSIG